MQAGLREALRKLTERIQRELRYDPHFHGEIGIAVLVKKGQIKGVRETLNETTLID